MLPLFPSKILRCLDFPEFSGASSNMRPKEIYYSVQKEVVFDKTNWYFVLVFRFNQFLRGYKI